MNTELKNIKRELRGETDIVFLRYFNGPRELLFDCRTNPELMQRWLIDPEGMVLET